MESVELCRHSTQRGKLKEQIKQVNMIRSKSRPEMVLSLTPQQSILSRQLQNESVFQLPPLQQLPSPSGLQAQNSFFTFREDSIQASGRPYLLEQFDQSLVDPLATDHSQEIEEPKPGSKKLAILYGIRQNKKQEKEAKRQAGESLILHNTFYQRQISGYNQLLREMPRQKRSIYHKSVQPESEKSLPDITKAPARKDSRPFDSNFESLVGRSTEHVNVDWKPMARENSQLVVDQIHMKGILTFGLGADLLNDAAQLDLNTMKWSALNQTGEVSRTGRFSHSAALYNKQLFIFGGERLFNQSTKQRECLHDIRLARLSQDGTTLHWKQTRPSGEPIEGRRNHATCQVGKYFVVSGGINNRNQYLDDFWLFDMVSHVWLKMPVEVSPKSSFQPLAFHQIQPVFHSSRSKPVPGKPLGSIYVDDPDIAVKEEGLYIFGGKAQSLILSSLHVLRFSRFPMRVDPVVCLGQCPPARYGHQLQLNSRLNILILHGGIGNPPLAQPKTTTPQLHYLSDLFVLKLGCLTWVRVQPEGPGFLPRAFFQMVALKNEIIVLGGFNQNGFVNFNIFEYSLSQNKSGRRKGAYRDKVEPVVRHTQNKEETQFIQNLAYNNFVSHRAGRVHSQPGSVKTARGGSGLKAQVGEMAKYSYQMMS